MLRKGLSILRPAHHDSNDEPIPVNQVPTTPRQFKGETSQRPSTHLKSTQKITNRKCSEMGASIRKIKKLQKERGTRKNQQKSLGILASLLIFLGAVTFFWSFPPAGLGLMLSGAIVLFCLPLLSTTPTSLVISFNFPHQDPIQLNPNYESVNKNISELTKAYSENFCLKRQSTVDACIQAETKNGITPQFSQHFSSSNAFNPQDTFDMISSKPYLLPSQRFGIR